MVGLQVDCPILNVSTFTTSVTLVERKDLDKTLETLSEELDAVVMSRASPDN